MAKILIVEDNTDLLEFVCLLLKKNNSEVYAASLCKEIEPHLVLFHPDIILLDVLLKDGDGREACKAIKNNHQDIPIILLSGNSKLLSDYIDYHADDIIEKPFTIDTLIGKIDNVLKGNTRLKFDD
jgi:DNA-binding response OmpR family regulator